MAAKKTTKKDENSKKPVADNKAEVKAEENAQTASSGLPMFYENIAALNASSHGDYKIAAAKDFSFAKKASSIVLAATEFAAAAVDYPIVFGKADYNINAFCVTGYANGENVFVGDDNKWRADTYIPAYVRRYPFLLVQSADDNLSLAVDDKSSLIGTKEGTALYNNGEASDAAKHALSFCFNYRKQLEATEGLLKQIDESGVLIERSAEVSLPGGEKKARIQGFSIVDEKKLSELADDKFLELRKSGALNLIYSHLWSMRSWNNLLEA